METLDLRPFKADSKIKIIADNGTIIEGHVVSWQLQQNVNFQGPQFSLSLEIISDNEGTVRIDKEIEKPREEIIY